MSDLYKTILSLCQNRNVNITQMCKESGASRASLTDLKMGRKQSLSAETLTKIADYFSVSVDYLLGKEDAKKAPAKQEPTDEDIMFALWGDTKDIDKDDLEDVKRYAAFIRERKKKK